MHIKTHLILRRSQAIEVESRPVRDVDVKAVVNWDATFGFRPQCEATGAKDADTAATLPLHITT